MIEGQTCGPISAFNATQRVAPPIYAQRAAKLPPAWASAVILVLSGGLWALLASALLVVMQ